MTSVRVLTLASATLLLAGCASYQENPPLAAYDTSTGYRYENLSTAGNTDELFVILAFSGGGTRAAAFSYGLLEALRDATYSDNGQPRRLLKDVDVISSVSGGSFTAAYYALFADRIFEDFEPRFLDRDVQGDLIRLALSPLNWFRLASSTFDRIDLAAEYYDRNVFDGRTYRDLAETGRKPYVIVNATDMSIGRRFEFTQEQFDVLCSDLSGLKVARAVAASSAFPGLLSPLTVNNYGDRDCGYEMPDWIENALVRKDNPLRRYVRAREHWSYRDPGQKYVHLLDGGLADNIGLRGPYVALTSESDSSWSVLQRINKEDVNRVVVITANAATKSRHTWDRTQAAPGLIDVLEFVATGPMDNYSFDTIQLITQFFEQMKKDWEAWEDCRNLLQQQCPAAKMHGLLRPVDFHFVEISFDALGMMTSAGAWTVSRHPSACLRLR